MVSATCYADLQRAGLTLGVTLLKQVTPVELVWLALNLQSFHLKANYPGPDHAMNAR